MASSPVTSLKELVPVSAHQSILSLEEYFSSVYHPDCDFVNGYLEERNRGETKHGLLQMEFGIWFRAHKEWGLRAVSEQRTRVSTTRVRIPDVAVVWTDGALKEKVRTTPAFIAIEILSPDDRMDRVLVRLKDFFDMGVQHVWLFDPEGRTAQIYTKQGRVQVVGTRLSILNSPIYVDLVELFDAALDGA